MGLPVRQCAAVHPRRCEDRFNAQHAGLALGPCTVAAEVHSCLLCAVWACRSAKAIMEQRRDRKKRNYVLSNQNFVQCALRGFFRARRVAVSADCYSGGAALGLHRPNQQHRNLNCMS